MAFSTEDLNRAELRALSKVGLIRDPSTGLFETGKLLDVGSIEAEWSAILKQLAVDAKK